MIITLRRSTFKQKAFILPEVAQCLLTFPLLAISVDGSRAEVVLREKSGEEISLFLRLHEYQSLGFWTCETRGTGRGGGGAVGSLIKDSSLSFLI